MDRGAFIGAALSAVALGPLGPPAGWHGTNAGMRAIIPFDTAPFPHASRASGHTYDNKVYDAATHYGDSSVGLFVPKGFVARDTVEYVVHFHGWNNNVADVFARYKLAEQFEGSGLNAILVVPQGPLNAPDSGDGKLELDDNGFARFIADITRYLQNQQILTSPTIGNIALSAHSGGYGGLGGVLTRGGMNDHISDVMLFDAGYGYFEAIAAWAKTSPQHHLLSIFTDDTSTGNTALMGMLQEPKPNIYVRLASTMTLEQLQARAPTFLLTTDVAHDELMQKFSWYQLFLQTTALNRR